MPHAHDYRDAALRLRRLALQLADDSARVRSATDPLDVAGGPLATILVRSLDAHLRHVERARDELDRVATICDRRAEICEEFAAALRRHARFVLAMGAAVPAPTPPAPWVGR